jgi:hypothetical protein
MYPGRLWRAGSDPAPIQDRVFNRDGSLQEGCRLRAGLPLVDIRTSSTSIENSGFLEVVRWILVWRWEIARPSYPTGPTTVIPAKERPVWAPCVAHPPTC